MTIGSVMAFGIATVPDVELGRRLHGLDGLTDKQVGYVMRTRQREQTGTELLPPEQHSVVAIAVAMRTSDGFSSGCLGEPLAPEADLVRRFFAGVERHGPILVSWNGNGFDLPVLHYRALRHHVQARRYWQMGDEDASNRRSSDVVRNDPRHVDLTDALSGDQGRGQVALDTLAQLLGLPASDSLRSADAVWEAHLEGRSEDIRCSCEAVALNTYLVHLRFELFRGRLTHDEHARETELVRSSLAGAGRPHLSQFVAAWPVGNR